MNRWSVLTLTKQYQNTDRLPVTEREEGKTLEKIAAKANCGYITAFQYKKIKEAGLVDRVKKDGESIKNVYSDFKREEKRANRDATLQSMYFPEGKYRVIYADPPWDMAKVLKR